jgi:hypothetical protein
MKIGYPIVGKNSSSNLYFFMSLTLKCNKTYTTVNNNSVHVFLSHFFVQYYCVKYIKNQQIELPLTENLFLYILKIGQWEDRSIEIVT